MKKICLGVSCLSLGLIVAGCSSESQQIKDLESKIVILEKENKELKYDQGNGRIQSEEKESSVSKKGARSNPVPMRDTLTFQPLFHNNEKLTAKLTDVKRGIEAEEEIKAMEYGDVKLDTLKRNIGGIKEHSEFMTYTSVFNVEDVHKDKGIVLPDVAKSLTIDGNELGYSYSIRDLDGFKNDGKVYVNGEYEYRMYGQAEKGKPGLISFSNINGEVFFEIK